MTHIALNKKTGLPLKYTNRHGLITGQTGTGKTVTLQRMAEQLSKAGVPVFISDVKGDIGALSRSCPTSMLDVFGETGKHLKTTVHSMGADLMARALELSDTQAAVLEIAFAYARDKQTPMHTLDDVRAVLACLEMDSKDVKARYGQVSGASIGVIMRALLRLEEQGGNRFFGNPQFDVADIIETVGEFADDHHENAYCRNGEWEGRGVVSILQAERLINSPRVYASFLLWLLTELWERLPEIGDMDKPRLVLFFDEAHLLFSEINPALLRRIEQTVRLIRSKGVGVYFVTQSPDDVPHAIREQLAFQITHERAYRIGQAHVSGLNDRGGPVNHGLVQIDLPECPLGALQPIEQLRFAPLPATGEPAPKASALDSNGAAYGYITLCVLAFIAFAIGGAWLMQSNYFAKGIAILLALVALGYFQRVTDK